MSIYEAIGTAWVIFTSAIATVELLYLAYVGAKTVLDQRQTISIQPAENLTVDQIVERIVMEDRSRARSR